MKSFPNIEKSVFRKGQYVGYGGGFVWRITKSTSSFGVWCARNTSKENTMLWAWTLAEMSNKLSKKFAETVK